MSFRRRSTSIALAIAGPRSVTAQPLQGAPMRAPCPRATRTAHRIDVALGRHLARRIVQGRSDASLRRRTPVNEPNDADRIPLGQSRARPDRIEGHAPPTRERGDDVDGRHGVASKPRLKGESEAVDGLGAVHMRRRTGSAQGTGFLTVLADAGGLRDAASGAPQHSQQQRDGVAHEVEGVGPGMAAHVDAVASESERPTFVTKGGGLVQR